MATPLGRPLTIKDFNRDFTLNIPGKVVVLFYRDQCPYCVDFKPIYAEYVKDNDTGATYAFVNTAKSPQIMKMLDHPKSPYNVNGVPMLASYNNGRFFSKFGGDRQDKRNVKAWASTIGKANVTFVNPRK